METKDLLEKLDKEITEQTRNGREDVYIEVDDLNKLGYGIDPKKTGRVYVDVNYLRIAMKRYEFKQGLKVETTDEYNPVMTYKEFIRSLRNKEKGEREDV